MTPAHHKRHARISINGQIDNHGGAGHSARGAARLHRGYRPVRVTPLRWQDTLGCPHLPGTLSPNQLGRGLSAPGPFPSFTDRVRRISSTALSAGDRHTALPPAVGRHSFHCGGPVRLSGTRNAFRSLTLLFKTTDHQARQSIDPSPATAHSCVSFATHNVAPEHSNAVHESQAFGSSHDH